MRSDSTAVAFSSRRSLSLVEALQGFEDAVALPSVSAELTGIVKILGGEIKLDDQFTQQRMRQTLLKHYPVVHFASHFKFQPGNDTKSSCCWEMADI